MGQGVSRSNSAGFEAECSIWGKTQTPALLPPTESAVRFDLSLPRSPGLPERHASGCSVRSHHLPTLMFCNSLNMHAHTCGSHSDAAVISTSVKAFAS